MRRPRPTGRHGSTSPAASTASFSGGGRTWLVGWWPESDPVKGEEMALPGAAADPVAGPCFLTAVA
jgi:hypothetical protein